MYSKIQPQQINLHDFSSTSGHLSFTKGSNYVYANLNSNLTGEFNIVGGLSVNGESIASVNSSNIYDSSLNFIGGGSGNVVNGTGNAILNSIDSTIDGSNNVIVNGFDCVFNSGASKNTILGGNLVTFGVVTGSTVIQDQTSSTTVSQNNSLYVKFASGIYFDSKTYFSDNVYFGAFDHLFLSSQSSGVFSGDINVGGNLYWKGLLVPTMAQLTGASGVLDARLISTGQTLLSSVSTINNAVFITGSQNISGNKTFYNDILLSNSSSIKATGSSANYIDLLDVGNSVSTGNLAKAVSSNSFAILLDGFGVSSQSNLADEAETNLDSCLIISSETSDIDTATRAAAFDSFGNCRLEGGLIMDGYMVPSSNADSGVDGLFARSGRYLYVKDSDTWTRFAGQREAWINGVTGALFLDGVDTSITWIDGQIQNEGRVDIFSTGGGGGGFTGNGVAGSLTLNGTVASSWSNGLNTIAGAKTFSFLSGVGAVSGALAAVDLVLSSPEIPTTETTGELFKWSTEGVLTGVAGTAITRFPRWGGRGSLRYASGNYPEVGAPILQWNEGLITDDGPVDFPQGGGSGEFTLYHGDSAVGGFSWERGLISQSGPISGVLSFGVGGQDLSVDGVRYSAVGSVTGINELPPADTMDFSSGLLSNFGAEAGLVKFLQPVVSGDGSLNFVTPLETGNLLEWRDGVIIYSGDININYPPSGYSEVLLHFCSGGIPASGYFCMRPA